MFNKLIWVAAVSLLGLAAGTAWAQGTAFTYQGRLQEGGVPVTGSYKMAFSLWDAEVGGAQIGTTITDGGVPVGEGLFAAELDFGADAFDNADRWLEIAIEGEVLSPRQPVSRAPYAITTRGIGVDGDEHVGMGVTPGSARLRVWNDAGSGLEAYTTAPGRAVEAVATKADMAVWGSNEDASGIGVYGQNQTTGNYGYLGSPEHGVVGSAADQTNHWAGYFKGRGHFSGKTFVGRDYQVANDETFGVHTDTPGWGGMYVSTTGATSSPFYAYSVGGQPAAWTYYDGTQNYWRIRAGPTNRISVSAATGWVGIGADAPNNPLVMGSGAYCSQGGTWTNASSRDLKQDFERVDARSILNKVAALPISTWTYNAEVEAGTRHLGPVAEDFAAAFGLGETDKAIATVDASGVALAAIQGLTQVVTEKNQEISDLEGRVAELEAIVTELLREREGARR